MKIKYKEVAKGLIITLFIIIPIVIMGVINDADVGVIFSSLIVTELGISFLWLISRIGFFSTSSFAFKRLGLSIRNRKKNKLGSYVDEEKKEGIKNKTKIEIKNKSKSKQGIYTMFAISLSEIIIMLFFIF